ncbi:(3R)-3-hydroxyacyl-CoA dehydrogenase-like isoform X2 [Scylla paramamosain]|uniref:(3R)-3-hydroxyacyl-CoA dehydrogenase-like isoform X2 n=1 Tax=Scylla paramamosain TaxID=85552 RepID=UPI00308390C5
MLWRQKSERLKKIKKNITLSHVVLWILFVAVHDLTRQCVCGGGSGIGRATCLMLARDGARVVVTDINLEAARETLSLMPNNDDHLALEMDVTQQSAAEGVIAAARERFGEPPSLLVNNAGIARGSLCHLMEEKDFDIVVNVNLKGTFLVTQAFVRELLKDSDSGKRTGAIVNMSSIDGKSGHENHCQYSATKGGVVSLTKSCAAELAKTGIRVNCVLPGAIDTRMTAAVNPEMRKRQHERTPIGRIGRPEEVAEVIVFLLSWRSSYMVGACVEVTGGLHM